MNILNLCWQTTLLFAVASGDCDFTRKEIDDTKRLFVVKENKDYKLLLNGTVGDGKAAYLLCPDSNISITSHRFSKPSSRIAVNCTKNAFDKVPIVPKCVEGIKPTIVSLTDASCNKTMYGVGYTIERQFVELYRSCYDRQLIKTSFTRHTIKPFKFLSRRPAKSFDTHGIITLLESRSFANAAVYQQLNKLFNNSQNYMTARNQNLISRGHLVRSSDYIHEYNRNATFAYINVIPQFSTMNSGLWVQVENFVKNEANRQRRELTIYTGTTDEVLELPNKSGELIKIYLLNDNRNPIPKWLYKVIANGDNPLVLLTSNNVFFEEQRPDFCKENKCPKSIEKKLQKYRGQKNYKQMGVTFCCQPNEFAKHFKHLNDIL